MNITVVGCGAMGSIYAALLADAGHEVSVIDTNPDHVNAINANGLRVSGASGDRTVQISAFTQSPEQTADLVICAVKARFVAAAAAAIQPLVRPDTCVLTIQNGLGSADVLAQHVNADQLIVGVAQGFGASLPAPGHAHHNDMKAIRMGAYAGLAMDTVAGIADVWAGAGFDAAAVTDIAAMQWEKLIRNAAYSAPCALSGLTLGEVLAHPQISLVSQAAAREAYAVARALGINLTMTDPQAAIREFAERMPDARPSVLLDVAAGRISEVDVINGAVPVQARKVDMQAPVNASLTTLVQALETGT